MATGGIRAVRAEGRTLDLSPLVEDQHDAELRTPRDCEREQSRHIRRPRVGGNIKVLGFNTKEFIAYASTGEIGSETTLTQSLYDRSGLSFFVGHLFMVACRIERINAYLIRGMPRL